MPPAPSRQVAEHHRTNSAASTFTGWEAARVEDLYPSRPHRRIGEDELAEVTRHAGDLFSAGLRLACQLLLAGGPPRWPPSLNHGGLELPDQPRRVLLCIANDPGVRLRDIAAAAGGRNAVRAAGAEGMGLRATYDASSYPTATSRVVSRRSPPAELVIDAACRSGGAGLPGAGEAHLRVSGSAVTQPDEGLRAAALGTADGL